MTVVIDGFTAISNTHNIDEINWTVTKIDEYSNELLLDFKDVTLRQLVSSGLSVKAIAKRFGLSFDFYLDNGVI